MLFRSPNEFIPLAEKTGFIVSIGNWVLYEASKQNKKWQELGYEPIVVSVNVSAKQLLEDDFVENIITTLDNTGLDPQYLELEITESTIMENSVTNITKLNQLKELGVRLSLDDFGTCYSSLSYLKSLPIDTLKIDRSFIQNIINSDVDKKVCEAIINLAHTLNLKVVAEGVEEHSQLKLLTTMNCDKIQGYYFSPPIIAEELTRFFRT